MPLQVSDQCVKLWSDGWFHDVPGEDAGMTRLVKDVIVVDKVSKDVAEVDNDRWLVPVKILDHEGPLQVTAPPSLYPPCVPPLCTHLVSKPPNPCPHPSFLTPDPHPSPLGNPLHHAPLTLTFEI